VNKIAFSKLHLYRRAGKAFLSPVDKPEDMYDMGNRKQDSANQTGATMTAVQAIYDGNVFIPEKPCQLGKG